MAGRRPPSDLGSDWIHVPRKFRGIKDTSSPTELAYITGAEKGLLSRFAKANQVGPANIPSFDDSGVSEGYDWSKDRYTSREASGWKPKPTTTKFVYTPPTASASKISRGGGKSVSRASVEKEIRDREMSQAPGSDAVKAAIDKGKSREVKDEDRMSGPERDYGDVFDDKDEDHGSSGDDSVSRTDPCQGRGRNPDGSCKSGEPADVNKCAGKSTDCPSDRPNGQGVCDPATGEVNFSSCTADPNCPHGKNPDGSCKDAPDSGNGGDPPSLNTILQPDETPMLQELTNDMDLRNMLTNVLNKNNPLFKQARTRALQAMAGRGVVNSSMAEEAVMNSIMNVAMPIATRVIDDLQRVMAANVNASNAFKEALNQAYYKELITRVDAANKWNLQKMIEGSAWSREMLSAKAGAANIKDEDAFKRYMDMLSGATA